jgi:hypothetical protein
VDDAENKRKLMVRAKNNLSPNTADKALAYHFNNSEVGKDEETGEAITAPYVIWEPKHLDVTATEAMQATNENKSPVARDTAKKLLLDMLANGPVPAVEIKEAAEANGIAERTLYRAKEELGIQIQKDRSKATGPWSWYPPKKPKWNGD